MHTEGKGDMRVLLSAVLSQRGTRKTAKAYGYRTRRILTCFGWIPVRFAGSPTSGKPEVGLIGQLFCAMICHGRNGVAHPILLAF